MHLNQIFFSYTRADAPAVSATARALRALGRQVWHDESDIGDGQNIVRRLEEGLERCRYIALFVSADYFTRPWTRAEYEAAIYAAVIDSDRKVLVVEAR